MQLPKALSIAEMKELDLVKIAPQAKPPVCKLMNYYKFKFETQKREKEARKNQKVISVKEVRLSTTIDTHDLEVKAKSCMRFLKDGDKVKVSIRFRGRQMSYSAQGYDIMNKFYEMVKEYGNVEQKPTLEGRNMVMILAPLTGKSVQKDKETNTSASK